MRITNGMMTTSTLRNINQAASRLAAANDAESSQKKIQLASDDPVVATRAVTYRSYVSQITQYQDNATAATGWQKATDAALSDLNDVITNAKELTTEASSDTCSDADKEGIAASIKTLQTQAISIMNTTYAGRYIFGGYNTTEEPYKAVTTTIGDSVTFKGNYVSLAGVVSSDISDADIKSFYSTNADSLYESSATLRTTTAVAKNAFATLTAAVTKYGSATTLADATVKAKIESTDATANLALSPTDTTLQATAKAAQNTYDTLSTAATYYGETATLQEATTLGVTTGTSTKPSMESISSALTDINTQAVAAQTTSDALASIATAYGTSSAATMLTVAKTNATNITTTLNIAVTNWGSTITLTEAVQKAQDALAGGTGTVTADDVTNLQTAVKWYGGDTTLLNADAKAQTDYDTLNTAVGIYGTVAASTISVSDVAANASAASATLATDVYGGTNTVAAAAAKTTYNTLSTAVTTYGGATSLTDAAAKALTAYKTSGLATDKVISDTLAAAITTYGSTATLSAAVTQAKTTSDTLATSVYSNTSSLTATAGTVKATYNTLNAILATYGTTSVNLTDAMAAAKTAATATSATDIDKNNYNTLAAAFAVYGGSAKLADAVTNAATTSTEVTASVKIFAGTAEQKIEYNIGFSTTSKVTVNTEGQDVVGEGANSNLFDTFSKLLLALNGDTSYKTASADSSGNVTVTTKSLSITDLIDELTSNATRLQVAQTTLGTRMDNVSTITTSLGDAYTAYKTLMSDNEDVDTSVAITEQASAEYCYNAALSIGAKAVAKTLIDYIG